MLTELQENLQAILDEKTNKVLPANIKSGVTIFNVQGTLVGLEGQEKTVTPDIITQIIEPDENYNGLTRVTISSVDHSIDNNIQAENIKKDVTILRNYRNIRRTRNISRKNNRNKVKWRNNCRTR